MELPGLPQIITGNVIWILVGFLALFIIILAILIYRRRRKKFNRFGGDFVKKREEELDEIKKAVEKTEKELVPPPKKPPVEPKPKPVEAEIAKDLPKAFDFPEEEARPSLLREINQKLQRRTTELLGMIDQEKKAIDDRLKRIKSHKKEIIDYVDDLKRQWVQLDNEEKRYGKAFASLSIKEKSLKRE